MQDAGAAPSDWIEERSVAPEYTGGGEERRTACAAGMLHRRDVVLPPLSGRRAASPVGTPLYREGGLAGQTAPAFSECRQLPCLTAVGPCCEEEPRARRLALASGADARSRGESPRIGRGEGEGN